MALISLRGLPLPKRGPRRSGTHFGGLLLKPRRIPIVFVFFASIGNDWRPCFCAAGLGWLSTLLPCLASVGQLLTLFPWQPASDESFNLTSLKAERFQLSTGHDSEAFFPLCFFPTRTHSLLGNIPKKCCFSLRVEAKAGTLLSSNYSGG